MTITTNKLAQAYLNPVEKDHIKQNSVSRQILEVLSNYLQIGTNTFSAPQSTRMALYDDNMHAQIGEQVMFIGGIMQETSSTGSYEKDTLFVRALTQDPSVYGGTPITRDAIAIDGRGTVLDANLAGRAWGGYFEGSIQTTGADGQAIGIEVNIINKGAGISTVTSTNPKFNVVLDAGSGEGAINPVTAGIYFNGGSTGSEVWYTGIYCPQFAINGGGNFIEFQNVFKVSDVGNVTGNTVATSVPVYSSGGYAMSATDTSVIFAAGGTATLQLPTASSYPGRVVFVKTVRAQAVESNAANVVSSTSTSASTGILAATAGKWAMLQSDGTNWITMASN